MAAHGVAVEKGHGELRNGRALQRIFKTVTKKKPNITLEKRQTIATSRTSSRRRLQVRSQRYFQCRRNVQFCSL